MNSKFQVSTDVKNNKSVNARQVAVLLFISLVAMRVIIMPSVLYGVAGRDAWISFLLASIFSCLAIWLILYVIKKTKAPTFSQLLKKYFGKIGAKIIILIILVFFLLRLFEIDREFEGYVIEALYQNVDWNIFLIPIFATVAFLAYKGVRVIGRVGEIFYIFAVLAFLLAICLGVTGFSLENILPIFAEGTKPIVNGIFLSFNFGGDFLFLLILIENIEGKKRLIGYGIKSAIFALTLLSIMICVFVATYGPSGIMIKDALVKIANFTPNISSKLTFDAIIVICFTPIIIIYLAINLYCAAWCVKEIFAIKKHLPVIVMLTLIIITVKFIPIISIIDLIDVFIYLKYFMLAFTILLPLLIAILLNLKKEGAYEKK